MIIIIHTSRSVQRDARSICPLHILISDVTKHTSLLNNSFWEDVCPRLSLKITYSRCAMKQLKEAKGGKKMEDGVTETVSFLHPEQEEEDHHHQDTAPGLLNHIFSNLVSKAEASEEKQEEEGEDKGGGILNNLISHLVTPPIDPKAGETSQGDEVEDKKGKEDDELVVKSDEDSGGGVIDKIVSHFPEDAVPTDDEASILIHSIVHD